MNDIEKDIEILKYYESQDYFFSKDMPALHAFRRAIASHEKQLNNGWMLCKDMLPELTEKEKEDNIFSKIYLVTFTRYDEWLCLPAYYNFDSKSWMCFHNFSNKQRNVIAWQSLPAPYKEKD